jgi:hypothetical protein
VRGYVLAPSFPEVLLHGGISLGVMEELGDFSFAGDADVLKFVLTVRTPSRSRMTSARMRAGARAMSRQELDIDVEACDTWRAPGGRASRAPHRARPQ